MQYEILESKINTDEDIVQYRAINTELIVEKIFSTKNLNLLELIAKKLAEYDAAFYVNIPKYNYIPKEKRYRVFHRYNNIKHIIGSTKTKHGAQTLINNYCKQNGITL